MEIISTSRPHKSLLAEYIAVIFDKLRSGNYFSEGDLNNAVEARKRNSNYSPEKKNSSFLFRSRIYSAAKRFHKS